MRKIYVLLICLIIAFNVHGNESTISFRTYYYEVCLQKTPVEEFETFLELHEDRKDLTIEAYRSAICFLWSDYYFNPVKKWNCFIKGKTSMEQLIQRNPNNIEIRFLRLTIQENIPDFLGYNSDTKEDRQFISENINEITDNDLHNRIVSYLHNNKLSKIN